jgi:hypothetical protein
MFIAGVFCISNATHLFIAISLRVSTGSLTYHTRMSRQGKQKICFFDGCLQLSEAKNKFSANCTGKNGAPYS